MVAVACTFTFAGCADDVYDPERGIQTEPKENPLGEGFIAPDGFNWSMINSVNLNVEVKDEFNGAYNYLVEVFTTNPLNEATATPIAAGVAKSGNNYTANINISNATTRLYIRQTDPKQRKEIYEYEVPENGGTLNCKLYITQASTRAQGTTRAENTITDPAYTEPTVPANAKELKDEKYNGGCGLWDKGNYIIKSGTTFTRSITAGGGVNIFVQGTYQGSSITLQGSATLTILSSGEVECNSFIAQSTSQIKNFNRLKVAQATMQEKVEFYNKKTFIGTEKIDISGSVTLHNLGSIKSEEGKELTILLRGEESIHINNFENATIHATTIRRGATIHNYGTIVLKTYDSTQDNNYLYNACTFIATEKFSCSNTLILDNGSITGAQEGGEWKPVKNFTLYNSAIATLKNNSIILAETLTGGNTGTFIGEGEGSSLSMIKAATTHYPGKNTFRGLVLDLGKEQGKGIGEVTKTNCSSVENGASKHTIETCAGIIYGGNEGGNTTEPEVPEISESNVYTFAFEDNWPSYGDFDMNDLVLVMPAKTLQLDKNGNVTRLKMRIELRAVGASKTLGAGVRFLQLPANLQAKKFTVNGEASSFEKEQDTPTYILFNNAHLTLWGNEGYKEGGSFINTLPDGINLKYDTKGFDIIMEIPASSGIKADVFNISNIDVFAITSPATAKSYRTEVHAAGIAPTKLADTKYFDKGNDQSLTKGQYYVSDDNLAWAIVVPAEFSWPLEYNEISTVYPYFKKWVISGGKQDGDASGNGKWYNYNNGKIYPLTQLSSIKKN